MSEDRMLIVAILVVWASLAVLYATVPMLDMPGSARIWGAGAGIFLVLALVVVTAERMATARRGGRPPVSKPGDKIGT